MWSVTLHCILDTIFMLMVVGLWTQAELLTGRDADH